jgi:PhnO protein
MAAPGLQKARIRKVTKADFDAIFQFVNELEGAHFNRKKQKEILLRNLKSKKNEYLVALVNGKVVGYISCHTQELLHHGGWIAEIQELFVARHARSAGIGKKLVDKIKTYAKKAGALQLEVTSNNNRSLTHRFYKKEHFEPTHSKFVYVFA